MSGGYTQQTLDGILNTLIGPAEFVQGTPNLSTKIVDLSTSIEANAQATIYNRAGFEIFYGVGTPSGNGLTTSNGISIPTLGYVTLDGLGGLCVWFVAGTPVTAGSGVRVAGGFRA